MPTADLILFPDEIDIACTLIDQALATAGEQDVSALGRVPSVRPREFVRVIAAGGIRETLVTRRVTLLLEGWAATETRARRLCDLACAAIYAADSDLFGTDEPGTPANLPDPVSKQERYTATVTTRLRASRA
ncbi:hypothetical protein [Leifsonia aquatica]|uniref:hypothetical protein n=1 Tax=Leifsonia aquatica TaxID=144185 RepID=UPI000469AD54|nr:hypothetical protein [Leifsonia aquatica]